MASKHGPLSMHNGPYKGDVSALCILPAPWNQAYPFLLAGTGPQLLLYDLHTFELLSSQHVFEGIRVHGIEVQSCTLGPWRACERSGVFTIFVVHGERRVKLYKIIAEQGSLEVQRIGKLINVHLYQTVPRLKHWILDVRFLKENNFADEVGCGYLLAVGTSDNSIYLWDINQCAFIHSIECRERCLLYSLRLWGDDVTTLHIAAGTIFNEILVWRLDMQSISKLHGGHHGLKECEYVKSEVPAMRRLTGHEGSIFRIAWSEDGERLASVSDDRSVRIWRISSTSSLKLCMESNEETHEATTFYGHTARIWDCHIDQKFLITVSEDCTYRFWTMDGLPLTKSTAHTGRGIWRCVYDPKSCILVTAGADSSIKAHSLYKWVSKIDAVTDEMPSQPGPVSEAFSFSLGEENIHCERVHLYLDSKSEYVRCLSLASPTSLYIATNRGFLKYVDLSGGRHVTLMDIHHSLNFDSILCMDSLRMENALLDNDKRSNYEDWIIFGDGKGIATVLCICWTGGNFHQDCFCSWSAEGERKLLGVYWSRDLGSSCAFTADAGGGLCMWSLRRISKKIDKTCPEEPALSSLPPMLLAAGNSYGLYCVHLAHYKSIFKARIICLDLHLEEKVLVCGDQMGNIVVFLLPPFSPSQSVGASSEFSPLATFKGAHGISTVASINIMSKKMNKEIEVYSTGRDGYICNFAVKKSGSTIVCLRVEKVPALTVVERCAIYEGLSRVTAKRMIVAGFTAVDFLLCDLQNNCEFLRVSCGGWRRPHTYLMGDIPEVQHCFIYVKDRMIHVHRKWMSSSITGFPSSMLLMTRSSSYLSSLLLQSQFHGREIHSVQFLTHTDENSREDGAHMLSWIATGAEDGFVRVIRLNQDSPEHFDMSLVLGEHVGGSAVRALTLIGRYSSCAENCHRGERLVLEETLSQKNTTVLLISVGAKEVMTCWSLEWDKELGKKNEILSSRWITTSRCPPKRRPPKRATDHPKVMVHENGATNSPLLDTDEDDQRYMAVTAFAVQCPNTMLKTCFVVTASSNATVLLHAFQLSGGMWVDLALLDYHKAPVLTLQHLVLPGCKSNGDNISDMYLVFTGATDGSIAVWDISAVVAEFSHTMLGKGSERVQRPPSGRGSQGGRRWRALRKQDEKQISQVSDLKDSIITCASEIDSTLYSHGISMAEPRFGDYERFSDMQKQAEGRPCSEEGCISEVPVEQEASSPLETQIDEISKNSSTTVKHVFSDPNSNPDYVSTALDLKTDNTKKCHPQTLNPQFVLPFIHQSGVNSLSVSMIAHEVGCMWAVVSGGDDQALHIATFTVIENCGGPTDTMKLKIVCLLKELILSAHSAAIKGVWTDGRLVFSTGLDQRLRCWQLELSSQRCALLECCHSIIDVPEPSALHVKHLNRWNYQIAVVGRGLQIIGVTEGTTLQKSL